MKKVFPRVEPSYFCMHEQRGHSQAVYATRIRFSWADSFMHLN